MKKTPARCGKKEKKGQGREQFRRTWLISTLGGSEGLGNGDKTGKRETQHIVSEDYHLSELLSRSGKGGGGVEDISEEMGRQGRRGEGGSSP